MYIHGNSSAKDIIFDLVKNFCTGNNVTTEDYPNNWKLIYPNIFKDGGSYPDFWGGTATSTEMNNFIDKFSKPDDIVLSDGTTQPTEENFKIYNTLVDNPTCVLKCMAKLDKRWIKNVSLEVTSANGMQPGTIPDTVKINLPNGDVLANNGNIRIKMGTSRYSLYRVDDPTDTGIVNFYIQGGTGELVLPKSAENTKIIIDYEANVTDKNIQQNFYLELRRPLKVLLEDDSSINGQDNYFYLTWKIGSKYDEEAHGKNPEEGGKDEPAWLGYPMVQATKLSWYKCNATTVGYVQDWLPIEYWLNITRDACVGVFMGDPGISATDYISSPVYFGRLEQIEGALETDDKGNFAGFSGSDQNPQTRNDNADKADAAQTIPRLKYYGDYTGTGITDIIMAASKGGIPYQGNKVGLFGMYEFKEQTFNGQSAFTDKHATTDIVVANVNENERGILRNCIGVPKNGKEHGNELVADRYIAGKEQTFIFLHINAPYTPFNTGNDVLIGFAIRTDN